MEKKILPFSLLLFVFFLIVPAYAANHYVDKNAAGSNNGSSWSNAWESFGAISWSSVNAGDIIYISGGSDSTIYNETLTVGKSGTSGSRIVISHGTESGHNGKVIIDGGNTLSNGILVNGRSYVTVTGFTVRYTHDGSIEVSNSDHIIVENCDITVTGRAGVYVRQNNNIEVRGCNIATGSYVNTQTDGMYSQLNTDNVYHNNHIVVNNSEPTGHDDCIQSYQDNNLTVHSNYLEQNNSKPNNSQGIYATTPTGGVFKFYNNIVNLTQSGSNGITFRRLTGVGTVQIVGNTAYGQNSATLIQTTEVDDPVIKNNVIYSGSAAFGARVINWAGNPSNIDNNIIYVPNSANVWSFNGVSKSWSQWKALGFDVHGKNADPKFTSINNKNFSLQQTSPGVDAGLAAGSPYNVDIMGVSRPQGQNYDMGAYEYNGGNPNPDTTPPEVTGASITNQTTVVVNFSEPLQSLGAQNPANYSISGGITVSSAVMNGTQVTLTTSPHNFNQQYTITVSSIKDAAGNLINPNANSAQYLLDGDTTPPEVTGASISTATQVIVTFSEALIPAGAQTAGNYTITNGIAVSSAVLSADGKRVTLTTSAHSSGQSYVVTVNNVKDLAGNVVNPNANTAGYSFFNDTTPPELAGAALSGNKIVLLTFSEEMDETSAEVTSNYSVDKGISIDSATLLNGGTVVSLSTSNHSPNTIYTVTVENVTDLAGNTISSQANSAQYQKDNGGGGGKRKFAVGKASAQWFQNFVPNNSVDENPDTTSESRWAGVLPMPDSIVFDLETVNTIDETHFSFYRWNQGRVYHFSVQVSVDDANWTEVLTDMVSSSSQWTINQFDSVQARYVKLILLSNNESEWAGLWEAEIWGPDQATETNEINITPANFNLEQNYPNPFNPTTNIRFNIPTDQHVRINVYNIIGELVTELVNKDYSAGNYAVEFNAADLPSGIYIYRLESQSFTSVRKMILVK